MDILLIYLAAGLGAGLVSGLFGVGGGLTVVPALVLALPLESVAPRLVMHMAISTSLAVMILTAAMTTLWRHRRGDLDWRLLARQVPYVALGGVVGATIGDALDGRSLRILFVVFVAFTIVRDARRLWQRHRAMRTPATLTKPTASSANRLSFAGHGIATGMLGALLGTGAAIITVPFLIRLGHTIQSASAQAAALSSIIGLAAGAGYVVGGLNETGLPSGALGYLYVPAFLGVATGALAGSPLGVKLSHVFSENLQRLLFVIYLSIVLVVMTSRLLAT